MTRIWFIFKAGIFSFMHVCLSISAKLFCKSNRFLFLGLPQCQTHLCNCCEPLMAFHHPIYHYYPCLWSQCSNQKLPQVWFHWASQVVMELYAITLYLRWVNVTLFLSHMTMSWFINYSQDEIFYDFFYDISGLILDRDNEKFLSGSIPLLCGLYSSIYAEVEIPGCVQLKVLYVMS